MSSQGLRPARKRRKADINIVPLIDVLVVLIFFFLVSMQFRNMTLLELVLPEMETAGESQDIEFVEIGVTREGRLFFNGEPVDQTALTERLKLLGEVNPEVPILISADEVSVLKDTTLIMDLCRQNGLLSISLQTR